MKYGLLYYKDTNNIGDDIQTYAAARFLPRIDYMIDRENLESFIPKKKEYVHTIMNAWYVHDRYNFNFSPYIYPLYISMFFKKFPYEDGVTYGTDYLNNNVISDLKKYGPVGTRDLHTKKILDNLNVDNYFSGCLTLTIEKFKNIKKDNYIVVNGLKEEEIDFIKSKTNRPIKVIKQDVKIKSFSDENWDTRKNRVEEILKIYQGAHMVITNKLHCSLPCLALETPILLLYDKSFKENKDRIGTYLEYLNYIDRDKFLNSNIDFDNPKPNSNNYLKLRKSLIKKCEKFVSTNLNTSQNELPNIDEYKKYVSMSIASRKPIIKHLKKLSNIYVKECEKASKMHDEINKLKNENNELLYRLNRIENSKAYKCYRKLSKLIRKK